MPQDERITVGDVLRYFVYQVLHPFAWIKRRLTPHRAVIIFYVLYVLGAVIIIAVTGGFHGGKLTSTQRIFAVPYVLVGAAAWRVLERDQKARELHDTAAGLKSQVGTAAGATSAQTTSLPLFREEKRLKKGFVALTRDAQDAQIAATAHRLNKLAAIAEAYGSDKGYWEIADSTAREEVRRIRALPFDEGMTAVNRLKRDLTKTRDTLLSYEMWQAAQQGRHPRDLQALRARDPDNQPATP